MLEYREGYFALRRSFPTDYTGALVLGITFIRFFTGANCRKRSLKWKRFVKLLCSQS